MAGDQTVALPFFSRETRYIFFFHRGKTNIDRGALYYMRFIIIIIFFLK